MLSTLGDVFKVQTYCVFLFPLDLRQLLIFILPVTVLQPKFKVWRLNSLKSLENQIWLLDLIN